MDNFNIKLIVNKDFIQEEDINKIQPLSESFKDKNVPSPLKLVCCKSKKNIMCDICEKLIETSWFRKCSELDYDLCDQCFQKEEKDQDIWYFI